MAHRCCTGGGSMHIHRGVSRDLFSAESPHGSQLAESTPRNRASQATHGELLGNHSKKGLVQLHLLCVFPGTHFIT